MLVKSRTRCIVLLAWLCFFAFSGALANASNDDNNQNAAPLKPAPIRVGEVQHLQWATSPGDTDASSDAASTESVSIVAPYSAHVRIPWTVTEGIRMYCHESGVFELFQELLMTTGTNELAPGTNRTVQLDGVDWYVKRPSNDKEQESLPPSTTTLLPVCNNLHWLAASDEASRARLISVLAKTDFDQVLDGLGHFFELDGIDIYSLGFVAATHSVESAAMTPVFSDTWGKAFHMLIPVQVKQGSRPQVVVEASNGSTVAKIQYEYGVALVFGDDTKHGTGTFDFRDSPGEINIALSIYLSDTNEENVAAIVQSGGHDQKPLPPEASQYLLQHRGRHWKKDGSVRLERDFVQRECTITDKFIQTCDDDDDDGWDFLDWTNWGFFDFQNHLQCEALYQSERPVPDEASWKKLREIYVSVVGDDKSTLSLPLSSDEDGFRVKVRADQSPGRGRGIFAAQFIPKGTVVYSTRQQARFKDGHSFKKLLMSVPVETACDLLAWMTVQNLDSGGGPVIIVELDKGSLVNGGVRADDLYVAQGFQDDGEDISNVGCLAESVAEYGSCKLNDFALRDIQDGEELLIDYHEFSVIESEEWLSLGLGKPGTYDLYEDDEGEYPEDDDSSSVFA